MTNFLSSSALRLATAALFCVATAVVHSPIFLAAGALPRTIMLALLTVVGSALLSTRAVSLREPITLVFAGFVLLQWLFVFRASSVSGAVLQSLEWSLYWAIFVLLRSFRAYCGQWPQLIRWSIVVFTFAVLLAAPMLHNVQVHRWLPLDVAAANVFAAVLSLCGGYLMVLALGLKKLGRWFVYGLLVGVLLALWKIGSITAWVGLLVQVLVCSAMLAWQGTLAWRGLARWAMPTLLLLVALGTSNALWSDGKAPMAMLEAGYGQSMLPSQDSGSAVTAPRQLQLPSANADAYAPKSGQWGIGNVQRVQSLARLNSIGHLLLDGCLHHGGMHWGASTLWNRHGVAMLPGLVLLLLVAVRKVLRQIALGGATPVSWLPLLAMVGMVGYASIGFAMFPCGSMVPRLFLVVPLALVAPAVPLKKATTTKQLLLVSIATIAGFFAIAEAMKKDQRNGTSIARFALNEPWAPNSNNVPAYTVLGFHDGKSCLGPWSQLHPTRCFGERH